MTVFVRRSFFPLLLCMVAVGGCGLSELDDVPENSEAVRVLSPVERDVRRIEAGCGGSSGVEKCRTVLDSLPETPDSAVLDRLDEVAAERCRTHADDVCQMLVVLSLEHDRTAGTEALLENGEKEAAGGLLAALDPQIVTKARHLLCQPKPWEGRCPPLLEILAANGDSKAQDLLPMIRLRRIVVQAAQGGGIPEIVASLPRGGQSTVDLVRLKAPSWGLGPSERELIGTVINAFGAEAVPFLLEAIKTEPMEVGLIAANLGWDWSASEDENYRRMTETTRRTLLLDEAAEFVGKHVTVKLKNGQTREGTLHYIDADRLDISLAIGGGTIMLKIDRDDVENIRY